METCCTTWQDKSQHVVGLHVCHTGLSVGIVKAGTGFSDFAQTCQFALFLQATRKVLTEQTQPSNQQTCCILTLLAMDTSAKLAYPSSLAFSCLRVRTFSMRGELSFSPLEARVMLALYISSRSALRANSTVNALITVKFAQGAGLSQNHKVTNVPAGRPMLPPNISSCSTLQAIAFSALDA